jgi:hypothetical protein
VFEVVVVVVVVVITAADAAVVRIFDTDPRDMI